MKHIILILALFSISAFADPAYEPTSGKWVDRDSDETEYRYNPIEQTWGYEEEDSSLEYDPLTEDQDSDSGWDYEDDD